MTNRNTNNTVAIIPIHVSLLLTLVGTLVVGTLILVGTLVVGILLLVGTSVVVHVTEAAEAAAVR